MTEPAEWKFYDQSSLPHLLRHDLWPQHEALSLLAGIDPGRSETFDPHQYYGPVTEDDYWWPEFLETFDRTVYWKIQLLADKPGQTWRTWYESTQKLDADCRAIDGPFPNEDSIPHEEIIKNHLMASDLYRAITEIFLSNPDHNSDDFAAPPGYFINWAASKNLDIEWLDWAKARGLMPAATEAAPKKEDKRASDSKLALIAALLNELGIEPKRANAKKIIGMTEDNGAPLSPNTIKNILEAIPNAVHEVRDRKRQ